MKNKNHPLYFVWKGLRQRCRNPNSPKYPRYGGRGITVDPRWDDFKQFAEDMGERPEGHTIDRIDNDGPYSPENCRWATNVQQANNRRQRKDANVLTVNGVTRTVLEWSKLTGINYGTILNRMRKFGMTGEDVLQPPIDPKVSGDRAAYRRWGFIRSQNQSLPHSAKD